MRWPFKRRDPQPGMTTIVEIIKHGQAMNDAIKRYDPELWAAVVDAGKNGVGVAETMRVCGRKYGVDMPQNGSVIDAMDSLRTAVMAAAYA